MGGGTYNVSRSMSNRVDNGYYTKSVNEIFTQNLKQESHEAMNPKGVTFRECRDSEAHPNSIPIIFNLDVTGSMLDVPKDLIKDGLPKLMGRLIQKGINDASVLFTAIGDHESDRYPLQVGQFESGDEELDLWLTRTYLEGNGGGNAGESYLLAWYFAAFHTKTDAMEKRGLKGILFTVGDEPCLKHLPGRAIDEIMGTTGSKGYTAEELLEKVKEKYIVYHLQVLQGSKGQYSKGYWRGLLNQNSIEIADYKEIPNTVSEIILRESVLYTGIASNATPDAHTSNILNNTQEIL